ncbi:hypothetical protein EVAR_50136_1 [Eumeta japonica]|uniref:Uncharacterized protein n=1 Tax=Eumeta variegata TaxID=151549 RepID=A0A4C1YTH1_EUMVA|nr:hypothetical protein EVAR_50136_1 [Eumeta japonica]
MKQRSLAVFGLVDIVVEYTLIMIGFQGLIEELEVWKFHHQTLKVNRGQNTFEDNSNKPKYARLDPCELRTVVPYTYTLSERSAELHGRRSGGY